MALQRVMGHELDKIYTDKDEFQLGAECEDEQGNVYVFVEYDALAAVGVAGLFAVGCDSAYRRFVATCDSTHADAVRNDPKGQLQAALTDGTYGWAQKKGYNRKAIVTDGSAVQGLQLMVSAGTRGVLTALTSNNKPVGTTRLTDTGTALAIGSVYLDM